MTDSTFQTEDRAPGIVLRFGYPADNSVRVEYSRFTNFGREWSEGFQRRCLQITCNDQCPPADAVLDLNRAADALGIVFGADATLTVEVPENPPQVHNWLQLAKEAAERLGWSLVHPFKASQEPDWNLS